MKLYILIFTFLTLLIPAILPAQLQIQLPVTIEILVNQQILPLSKNRLDSLRLKARSGKVHYKIAGINASQQRAQICIYVPQIFSVQQVCDQVIFYYSLISTEEERQRDHLSIYPFFANIEEQPYITCTYQPAGKFFFTVRHWPVVPVPAEPDPQQKNIYNQIINEMLEDYPVMENIDPAIINQVAKKNKLPSEQVRTIYQNTILWQEAQ